MLGKRNFYRKSLTLGSVSVFALSFGLAAVEANEGGAENAAVIAGDTIVIPGQKGTVTAKKVAETAKKAPKVAENSTRYQIAAQPLAEALLQFSTQTDVMVIAAPDLLQGKNAPRVVGPMSSDDALKSLLKDSGLDFQKGDRGEIIIRRVDAEKISSANSTASRNLALANTSGRSAQNSQAGNNQAGNTQAGNNAEAEQDNEPFLGPLTKEELEEIVVTGSNIRGVRSASPVFVYGRKDIDQTGVSTLPQFMQTLPQNFGGGISESNLGVVPSGDSLNRGTGINLRGLGNDSTLVLLNGRRLAPAGFGNFVDISMIPITAIERVEVLTDGASAIYGSDAVGGVVNFRLRDDYEGAETRVRYGTATSGDLDDIQVGQTFGTTWDTGYALISYEYSSRDALDTNDRSFTANAEDPTDLLPEQERHSIFITAGQSLNETVEVFGDTFYSNRESDSFGSEFNTGLAQIDNRETEQYGASIGIRAELSQNWQSELVGNFSQNNVSGGITVIETGSFRELDSRTSKNWSIDGKIDGTLFKLPGGDLKLAVGGQYRRETYTGLQPSTSIDIDASRDIYATYGEMFLPLVGEDNRRSGVERLELTVAGRHEDYSDFGASTDSKLGLLWSPVEGLNLRGTYGTSFRAPLFNELDVASFAIGFLFPFSDPSSPSGTRLAVLARGNNAGLEPETATTWTAGVDISPSSIKGLNIQATYFDINFKNRIAAGDAFLDAFTDPRWVPILDFNPDPALLTFLEAQPFSANFAGEEFDFADAEALIDNRLRNLAGVLTRGLDVNVSYSKDLEVGSFAFNLGGTYLFEQLEQLIETDEPIDLAGTAFNPPNLKLRSSINWAHKGFSTNLAVNYVDGFRNERVDPVENVSSWTTVDLNFNYSTGDGSAGLWLDNTVFSLTTLNLFDRDPPFVTSFFEGVSFDFDPTNANALGRTIAFQITKRW